MSRERHKEQVKKQKELDKQIEKINKQIGYEPMTDHEWKQKKAEERQMQRDWHEVIHDEEPPWWM